MRFIGGPFDGHEIAVANQTKRFIFPIPTDRVIIGDDGLVTPVYDQAIYCFEVDHYRFSEVQHGGGTPFVFA